MARARAKMCFPFAIMDAIMIFMHSVLSLFSANNAHFFRFAFSARDDVDDPH